MIRPQTLHDYFVIVNDVLDKTFRDDVQVLLAVKTAQVVGVSPTNDLTQASGSERTTNGAAPQQAQFLPNIIQFGPRLFLNRDGTAFGKLKVGARFDVPDLFNLYLRSAIDTTGAFRVKSTFSGVAEGLQLKLLATANTIQSPSDDHILAGFDYIRPDFYCNMSASRLGCGGTATVAQLGLKASNVLVGMGIQREFLDRRSSVFKRQAVGGGGSTSLSAVEKGSPLSSSLTSTTTPVHHEVHVGAGMHGQSWCLGGRMRMENSTWSGGDFVLYQKFGQNTSISCRYGLSVEDASAVATLGIAQQVSIPLPSWWNPQGTAPSLEGVSAWWLPCVAAVKADSDGLFCSTLRGTFRNVIRWGFTVQANMLDVQPTWKYGVSLTFVQGQ